MEQLEHLSFKGQKALFNRLEELARIANMNKKERAEYEAALKIYRDNENVMDYAVKTAEKKGLEKGIAIGEERGSGRRYINNRPSDEAERYFF